MGRTALDVPNGAILNNLTTFNDLKTHLIKQLRKITYKCNLLKKKKKKKKRFELAKYINSSLIIVQSEIDITYKFSLSFSI